jgi:hypothetical protein
MEVLCSGTYNLEKFRKRVQEFGVPTALEASAEMSFVQLSSGYDFMPLRRTTHASTQNLK